MEEIWKDIKGYEQWYQVSNTGKVRSVDRYINCAHGRKRKIKGQELVLRPGGTSPYLTITLKRNGVALSCLVHRLVAEAFLPDWDEEKEVNHKDGNCLNNHANNLEMVTSKENKFHCNYILREQPATKKKVTLKDKKQMKLKPLIPTMKPLNILILETHGSLICFIVHNKIKNLK